MFGISAKASPIANCRLEKDMKVRRSVRCVKLIGKMRPTTLFQSAIGKGPQLAIGNRQCFDYHDSAFPRINSTLRCWDFRNSWGHFRTGRPARLG